MPAFDPQVQAKVTACGVIAVLVIDEVRDAVPLARALLAGGITAMELTLRIAAALDALKAIRQEVPEMLAGIGTILTPAQVEAVVRAGAAFGVAPGCNRRVVEAAQAHGLSFAPGICTPSDIEAALELGCRLLKFFPAETCGGLKHLESMAAPYLHLGLRYVPLGGLTARNMVDYLATPLVPAVGGSWLAKRDAIKAGDWAGITANAREARNAIDQLRHNVDVLIANEEDAHDVLGIAAEGADVHSGKLNAARYRGVAERIVTQFPNIRLVAITLRESQSASHNNWGAMLYDADKEKAYFAPNADGLYCPYDIRNIVDRVGGGDAFGAALIFALNTPDLKAPKPGGSIRRRSLVPRSFDPR